MWHNLAQLAKYRGLIQALVARDLKARYRGSILGVFWSFINPLILLSIYTVVFTKLMPRGDNDSLTPYSVFLFSGLLPWTWFSSAVMEATGSIIYNGNLIKKVLFPAEVLPIVSVFSTMVHFLFGLPILGGFIAYYAYATPGHISLHASELVWLPVVILIQLIFTTALALLLSALTVHFRDIKDLIGTAMTFWFFVTPIIYSWRSVIQIHPEYKLWLDLNPFTHLVVPYQEILFFPENQFGHWKWLLAFGLAAVGAFIAAYWVFDRLRDSFAEAV